MKNGGGPTTNRDNNAPFVPEITKFISIFFNSDDKDPRIALCTVVAPFSLCTLLSGTLHKRNQET